MGDVVVDLAHRRVWVVGTEVTLARREYAMLASLVESRGRVVFRQRLFEDVWDDEIDSGATPSMSTCHGLRSSLAPSQHVTIVTLRGVGYRLIEHPE